MSRSHVLCHLVVSGCVGLWLAFASALAAAADEQSQKARDIRWFLDKATQAAAGIDNATLRDIRLMNIAEDLTRAGDFAGAMATVAGMGEGVFKADAYCSIAVAQAKGGDTVGCQEAIALSRQAAAGTKDTWQRAHAYLSVAKAEAKVGDAKGSKEAIGLARKTVGALKDASERDDAYPHIAEAQNDTGDFAGALATVAGIAVPDRKVDALLYIARGQAKAGNPVAAKQALDLASGVAADMKDAFSKGAVYLDVAEWQAKVGNPADAKVAIDLAEKAVAAIQEAHDKAPAGEMLAHTYLAVADFAASLRTAGAMDGGYFKAATYCRIAEAQAKAGNSTGCAEAMDLANKAAAESETAYQKQMAYYQIAGAQARVGNIGAAKEALELAKGAAPAVNDAASETFAYGHVAEAQARAGDFAGAMATAAHIEHVYSKADRYCSIAKAQAKAGDTAGAKQAIELAREAAAGAKDAREKAASYLLIAEARVRVGEVEDVKAWVETLTDPREVVSACLGAVKGLQGEEDK